MCGVAGYLAQSGRNADSLFSRISAMTGTLLHRGPDAAGHWLDEQAGITLGHRRLSVIDPTDAGAQPMLSSDERWVMIYSGELYNTAELRHQVEQAGPPLRWRGHSDTEVILEAVSRWGVLDTLRKCNGMYAIAF